MRAATMLRAARTRERALTTTAFEAARYAFSCFAVHDWFMFAHFALMWTLLALSGSGGTPAAERLVLVMSALTFGCWFARAAHGVPMFIRSAAYRILMVVVVLASYLMLRDTLPLVQAWQADGALNALDVATFGVEPSVWLEQFSTRAVVEYFAFFYFSYFVLCALFALGTLGPRASTETSSEFAIGTSVVYGLGQLGYVLVPGRGPVHQLAEAYASPLDGGFFWQCVLDTVAAGSAMGDVFPSLHTAAPVWFSLFSLRRARRTRAMWWWVVAAVTAVFALNIVASTIVLRWHYAVDLVAGVALAGLAAHAAPRFAALESKLRARLGLSGAWSFAPDQRKDGPS